jgi:hypothetical protein
LTDFAQIDGPPACESSAVRIAASVSSLDMHSVRHVGIEFLEPRRLLSTVTASSGAALGPSAALKITLSSPPRGTEPVIFTVTYRDADGVNPTSFDNRDLRISGPNRFARYARVISSTSNVDGTRQVVRYEIAPPGQLWDRGDNGTYTVRLHGGEVFDQPGNAIESQKLGTFTVNIPQRATATPNRRQLEPTRRDGTSRALLGL